MAHFGKKPYKCNVCYRDFVYFINLERHLLSHNQEKPFKCTECDAIFAKVTQLKKHSKIHIIHNKETPYHCTRSCVKFVQDLNLIRNCNIDNKEKPLKNNSALTKKSDLKSQPIIYTEEIQVYNCSECYITFTSEDNLNNHMKSHMGDNGAFKCTICNVSFDQINVLKIHSLTHTEETPFKCFYCDATFRSRFDLNIHTDAHTGEYPYKCSVCGLGFVIKENLEKHIITNHGMKVRELFKCSQCDATFAYKLDLKQHTNIHSEYQFNCRLCNKKFTQESDLKSHSAIHTGRKPL